MIRQVSDKIYSIIKKRIIKKPASIRGGVIRCGNDYGGFDVYPEMLKRTKSVVYSFGIGEDLSFSEDILRNFNADIYAFDPTPKAIQYVKRNPIYHNEHFHFYEYALGTSDGKILFHLPINENYVSGSLMMHKNVQSKGIEVVQKCILSIMRELGHTQIDILKIDIEGSEFSVIEDVLNNNILVHQICVEIHDRFFKDGLIRVRKMFRMLRDKEYVLVSVSSGLNEFTFVNLKR